MKSQVFDVHVRTLECSRCGAPIATGERGGEVTCAYCGVVNTVASRRAASGAGAKPSMAQEIARLSRLKAQLQHPVSGHAYDLARPPAGFSLELLRTPKGLEKAVQDLRGARSEAASPTSASAEQQRGLCWLALAVAGAYQAQNKPLEARAVLETALETLADEGHRHLVRCRLAVAAVHEGDLASAEGWLDECDPAPEVLELDSAYRDARARLASQRDDGAGILAAVGAQAGDIPFAKGTEAHATLLRIHGLELCGRAQEAYAALEDVGLLFAPQGAVVELQRGGLAPETTKRFVRHKAERELEQLGDSRAGLVRGPFQALVPALAALPLMAAVLMVPITVSRCTLDADPLLGVYGYALCPKVCEGCEGRARTVTVWHQTGPGEYSSDGAEYFCASDKNGVAEMTDEQLEEMSGRLSGASLNFVAVAGASYLLLMGLLFPLVPIRAGLRWWQDRAKLQWLDAEVQEAAQALGVAPPEPPLGTHKALGATLLFVLGAAGAAATLVGIGMAIG